MPNSRARDPHRALGLCKNNTPGPENENLEHRAPYLRWYKDRILNSRRG